MRLKYSFSICLLLFAYFVATIALSGGCSGSGGPVPVSDGPTVKKDERWSLVSTEFGEISAVKIRGGNGSYYLQFITLYPRALFLPVYLHSEMVLYVNSGDGTLSWMKVEKDKLQQVMLQKGDVFRLSSKTVFYIQNNAVRSYGYQAEKLQIYAIFPGSEVELQTKEQLAGVYTAVNDLVLGFDDLVLQSTFGAPQEVIKELRGGENQTLIVEGRPEAMWEDVGSWGTRALLGTMNNDIHNVENKMKAYNIFKEDHDVETYFGWSVTVTGKELDALKHTNLGVFMVNLTKGSMMEPHWNPNTAEVAIVLQGEGMIHVVCPRVASETGCKKLRLKVEEGDVFVVPRNHPMAQLSFNNNSFVFMGFKLVVKDERPQYLTGKHSILQRLDRSVLRKSFNVKNTAIDWVLSNKREKIISQCISCAEEEAAKEEGGGGGAPPPEEEEGGGAPPPEEGGGGGGAPPPEEEGGGGGAPPPEEEGGGGAPPPEEGGGGGGAPPPEEEGGGGGAPPPEEEGGDGAPPPGGGGGAPPPEEEGGGGGAPPPEEEGGGGAPPPEEGGGGGGAPPPEEKDGGGGVMPPEAAGGSGGAMPPKEQGGWGGGMTQEDRARGGGRWWQLARGGRWWRKVANVAERWW